jgi:hypothetical protein
VDLDLVEDAGRQRELGDPGAVDQHVLVTCGALGLGHRGRDVVRVGDQRPPAGVCVGLAAHGDEDRHAVVVVAVPVAGGLDRAAAGDDRPRRHELVHHPAVGAAEIHELPDTGVGVRQGPLVEAVAAVAEAVVDALVGPCDESVEGHGHVEDGCGHGVSLPGGLVFSRF